MNKIEFLIITAIFSILIPVFTQSEELKSNDLVHFEKYLQLLTQNSYEIKQIQTSLQVLRLQFEISRADLFPKIDLTATHGIMDSSPENLNSSQIQPGYSKLNLSLSYDLFNNNQFFSKNKIDWLNFEKAKLTHEESTNKIKLDGVKLFLDYSYLSNLLQIKSKQIVWIEKQFKNVNSLYLQGKKTQKDFKLANAQKIRSEIDLDNIKSELSIVIAKLNQSLKSEENTITYYFQPIQFEELTPEKMHQLSRSLSTKNNFTNIYNKIAEINIEIQKESHKLYPSDWTPDVYIKSGFSIGTNNYHNNWSQFQQSQGKEWFLILTAQYNFLDFGARKNKHFLADNQVKAEMLLNKISNSNFQLGIMTNKLNLEKTLKNIDLAHELLKIENENMIFTENEFKNGRVSFDSLIYRLDYLTDAENKYYTNIRDYLKNIFELQKSQGEINAKIL